MASEVTADERLDSRDLIERLEELEALERSLDPEQDEEATGEGSFDEDEQEELKALRELANAGIEDWPYGAQFIREDKFEDYARELAEDIGAIDDDARWPATCIDWKQAAEELASDFTTVEFMGSTYYVR
jgi:hypothetical protein